MHLFMLRSFVLLLLKCFLFSHLLLLMIMDVWLILLLLLFFFILLLLHLLLLLHHLFHSHLLLERHVGRLLLSQILVSLLRFARLGARRTPIGGRAPANAAVLRGAERSHALAA